MAGEKVRDRRCGLEQRCWRHLYIFMGSGVLMNGAPDVFHAAPRDRMVAAATDREQLAASGSRSA